MMKHSTLSVIIPTHNRAKQLHSSIQSVLRLKGETDCELIVVDNNSRDETKKVVSSFGNAARYIFEANTSFSRARNTGAEKSRGDVLLYLDDDVIVRPGSFRNIMRIFSGNNNCGVIAGKILPKFIGNPPHWARECQKCFNGWSLYNPEQISSLTQKFQEVSWAAGPMIAVKHELFDKAGGFPPDTVGVETNRGDRIFSKLYVGPGDYGLCYLIRKMGYPIYYASDVSVFHVIAPIRYTVKFWRSRMIGEGQQEAITQRGLYHLSPFQALIKRVKLIMKYRDVEKKFLARLSSVDQKYREKVKIFPEELWAYYYRSYLDMDRVLRKNHQLWRLLWKIGAEGVSDGTYDGAIKKLPVEYLALVSEEYIYNSMDIRTIDDYQRYKNRARYPH